MSKTICLCFCMLQEKEVSSYCRELKDKYPTIKLTIVEKKGVLEIFLEGDDFLDELSSKIICRFQTFYFGQNSLVSHLQEQFILQNKTLALAESCTGGAVAAEICKIPDASKYFLGSIVAYSDHFKELFLEVSRTTLQNVGAVSKEAVVEMVKALFDKTNTDFALAVSGFIGPSGGFKNTHVQEVYIAVAQRGTFIDVGKIIAPFDRKGNIELLVALCLGALWRRIRYNQKSFS
jgi:PncC family amidohydrolase